MRTIILNLLFLSSLSLQANICVEVELPESDSFSSKSNILINSFDNVKISANLLTPKNSNKKHPTIIFVNSWMLEEHEYIFQATKLARKGFQVLSYSTRGWGCSGGTINVVGPKDIKDLGVVIDWLEASTDVDSKNIGIAGISYGGGITLMALAKEPRIKTGFAMSAWGSLSDALYGNNTPRKFWGALLVYGGVFFGNLGEDVESMFDDLMNHRNIKNVMNWAKIRSPITYIEELNKRRPPVYISNNFGDNLFQPNNVLNYYAKLKGPKILDLNQGTHASGELTGLFSSNNYTFKKLHHWFSYWLMNIQNEEEIKLNTVNIQTDVNHSRETFSGLMDKQITKMKLNLHPNIVNNGSLRLYPYSGRRVVERFRTSLDTDASTGIPLISALIDGNFRLPVQIFLPDTALFYGSKFVTASLRSKLKIRGIPNLRLKIPNEIKTFHLNAYLYEVNRLGMAKLITHGTFTRLQQSKGVETKFDFVATAYDLAVGSKLALVLDGKDPLYLKPNSSAKSVAIELGNSSSSILQLPILKN